MAATSIRGEARALEPLCDAVEEVGEDTELEVEVLLLEVELDESARLMLAGNFKGVVAALDKSMVPSSFKVSGFAAKKERVYLSHVGE
jgi:hypothetical protein